MLLRFIYYYIYINYLTISNKAIRFEEKNGIILCTRDDAWGIQESKTHSFFPPESYNHENSLNYLTLKLKLAKFHHTLMI